VLFATHRGFCSHVVCDCVVCQVLFLKDINLPRPDKYDTCALIAFLQQLVTFKGFYDEHLEFLGIERVHIVCTMNPATTVGRHPLSTRWVHVCVGGGVGCLEGIACRGLSFTPSTVRALRVGRGHVGAPLFCPVHHPLGDVLAYGQGIV
jgi:hypothetical protein